ncbi:dienelactone hydrolase family protein [Bacillus sp. CLL-7-23]|uniref:Dienelactone hydrolase family protein n=1 Tax=Bacillus changyiensis TaxID=3004103 RepID=A0ABT4X533_9BACI|nr:alpha/beta fold hydrolase [Bacillus changyiensis]MDA7027407.1 dienelactone hydrolase family protein [Bacillus changyiensis]
MRILEILLTLSSFVLLFHFKMPKKVALAIGLLNIGLLTGHFFLEGYRWQMFFVYLISSILTIYIIFRMRLRIKVGKPLAYILFFLMFMMLILSTFASLYIPVFDLPKPDGQHTVGTKTFHLVDQDRDEVLTKDPHDKRELMIQVWYPADHTNLQKPKPLFPEDKQIFKKYIQTYASGWHLPEFVFDYWRYINSNSYENAEILSSKKSYPLVLISHGYGTGRMMHTAQAENLASHGFIVVAIDHTYSTTATVFPDGRITGLTTDLDGTPEKSTKLGGIWTKDTEFVISQIKKMNNTVFNGKIDLNHIGIMGHSFGGATAFNASYANPEIKAGINMDGSLYNLDKKHAISKPFLFIESDDFITIKNKVDKNSFSDKEIKDSGLTKKEFMMMIKTRKKEFHIIDQASLIHIDGTGHYNFTDFQLFSKILKQMGMTGEIDHKRSAFIVNQYVLDFFNKHLKGVGGDLISRPNPDYPEVKFPNQ